MAALQGSTSTSVQQTLSVSGEARANFLITNPGVSTVFINLSSLGPENRVHICPKDYELKAGKSIEIKDIVFNTGFTFLLATTGLVEYYVWTTLAQSGQTIFEHTDPVVSTGGGGDKHYIHEQSVAASTWTITHNLGKYPAVTITTSAGDEVFGLVHHISVNTTELLFSSAFSGKAFFN